MYDILNTHAVERSLLHFSPCSRVSSHTALPCPCSYVFSCAYSRHVLRAFTVQKCLRLLSITLHFCIYLSALPHLPIFDLYAAHICTVCIPCTHASMYVACSYSLYLCMRCITREGPVLLVSTSNK